MKNYISLFSKYRDQDKSYVFASFFPPKGEHYDTPFIWIAKDTQEGIGAWSFSNTIFQDRYTSSVPILQNYLNYTFMRLVQLENLKTASDSNMYFVYSDDNLMVAFNTGLQTKHNADMMAVFQRYIPREGEQKIMPDWVFRRILTPQQEEYITYFGHNTPSLAWYTNDSSDYVYNTTYSINTEINDHLLQRAKERSGMPQATDEIIKNYLCGVIERIIPKIKRNYKIAIPMFYIETKTMQILLPYEAIDGNTSCLLVSREDHIRQYKIRTILDMDKAYFAARLITRPDKDWLVP